MGGLNYNAISKPVRIPHKGGPAHTQAPSKNPFWSVLQIYNIDVAFLPRSAVQEKRTCNLFFNFVKSRIIMEEKTMKEKVKIYAAVKFPNGYKGQPKIMEMT